MSELTAGVIIVVALIGLGFAVFLVGVMWIGYRMLKKRGIRRRERERLEAIGPVHGPPVRPKKMFGHDYREPLPNTPAVSYTHLTLPTIPLV